MPSGLTIIEAAKRMNDPAVVGVVQTLAGGNPVLEHLRFFQIPGKVFPYNREALLPTIAFRGVNATYTASTGIVNPEAEVLRPMGGVSDTDRFLVMTDPGARAAYDAMMIKSAGRTFAAKFFEGDNETTGAEFDGLKSRITGTQLVSVGATASGISLNNDTSIAQFDAAIRRVARGGSTRNDIKIFMSGFQMAALTQWARDNTNHQLDWPKNEAGVPVPTWSGYEIVETDMDDDDSQTPLISITELDGASTNSDTTSIYIVRFGSQRDYVMGIEHTSGITVEDKGSVTNATTETTLVEWFAGLGVFHPRAAARLRHLKTT